MFIACGINHKTAPIQLREKVAIHESTSGDFLKHFISLPHINEVAVLSTCNRTEIYCELSDDKALASHLAEHTHLPLEVLSEHIYIHKEDAAIKHALRVASGLDSMIVGEPQIFGQVKQAYAKACEVGTAKSMLKQVFPFVFRASKRIRTESGINKHTLSVASVAAKKILNTFVAHRDLQVLVIGTGEMAELTTKYLSQAHIQNFWVTSRTEAHAEELAKQYQAKAFPITALNSFLPKMDVVITATACPIPFITPDTLTSTHQSYPLRKQFFLDLALPRNISEEITALPGITLCNIDDLQTKCQLNQAEQAKATKCAEHLLEEELLTFLKWSDAQTTQSLIQRYRKHMHTITLNELELILQKKEQGACELELLEKLAHRLYKKLTHLPTISLRQAALEGKTELLEHAEKLLTEISYQEKKNERLD